jgi:hypothetical protein
MNLNSKITSWLPETGWILLLPSRLPDQAESGIILPESYTRKPNAGICFSPQTDNPYLNKEILFAQHQEYQVIDTDTGILFYILEINKIILTRTPPPHVLHASWEKGMDSFSVSTVESSLK